MYLCEGPVSVICYNYEDRMLQLLFVDIHGLQEVLLLQMCHAIQGFIFQVVTTPYVDTDELAGFLGYLFGLSFLIHFLGIVCQNLFNSFLYFG